MFGGVGKRGFVRTDISVKESTIGAVLLLLVAGIGIAIYSKGQHFDPHLFALDQSLLSEQAPVRKEVKLVERSGEGRVAGVPSSVATGPLQGLAADGWRELGSVEFFTAETLYEKINGRAEQYLAYDATGMEFVALVGGEGQFIDVFLYDMGGVENAFGIYAVERPEEAQLVKLGRQGYRAESSYFFYKGNYYAQIIASDSSEEIGAVAEEIARVLAGRLEAGTGRVWGIDALPEENRVSVQYFKRDALSLDFLRETYTAKYRSSDGEWTAFVARHASQEEAAATMAKYLGYLGDYGELSAPREVDGAQVITGDLGGFFDVIFQKGTLFAGVNLVEGRELAERGADTLLRNIVE